MNKEISIQENNPGLRGKENELFTDVCRIIDGARDRIATHLNTKLCLTNWYIGHRIKEDVLYNQRAEYGKQVIKNLAKLLTDRYGSGWKYEKLKQCIRVAYAFSEEENKVRAAYPIDLDTPSLIDRCEGAACKAVLCRNSFLEIDGFDFIRNNN